jgi:hypothetical protein
MILQSLFQVRNLKTNETVLAIGIDCPFGTILSVSNQLLRFTWSYWYRTRRICNVLRAKHVVWSIRVFASTIATLVSSSSD